MIGWSLAAIAVLWGLLAFAVFRRFTDRAVVRTAAKRLHAHVLGIRLFSDEPALVWRAQRALLVDNLRFLALVWKPALITGLLFALLYGPLDSIYGWRPLEVGHSAVVTAQLSQKIAANTALYVLQVPPGIALETPPVRDFAERQISWRIRALTPVRGNLRLNFPSGVLTGRIAAGERTLWPNRPRQSSFGEAWLEVYYPRAMVSIAGLSLPWLAWFLILSTGSAAVAAIWPKRRFRHF